MNFAPESLADGLRQQCGYWRNPALNWQLPGQPKWIVLDPAGQPIGTAETTREADQVIERWLQAELVDRRRNPADYLADPEEA